MAKPTRVPNEKTVVKVLHKGRRTKAFSVHIPEGKYIVIDYRDRFGKNPDTEIYTEGYLTEVRFHTSEYKAASYAVTEYLKDLSYKDDLD